VARAVLDALFLRVLPTPPRHAGAELLEPQVRRAAHDLAHFTPVAVLAVAMRLDGVVEYERREVLL
jgi:hypothetical protein